MTLTFDQAVQLDKNDPLAKYKDEFYIQEGHLYMDGNSLGLLSKRAETALNRSLNDWTEHGIDGWTDGAEPWFYLSEKLGEMTAPLLGAKKDEVISTGSITTNLHQMVATFFQPKGKKTKILTEELAFPTDMYVLQSQLSLQGLDPNEHLIVVKSKNGHTLDEDTIIENMTDEVALVVLPSVLYRSGQLLNMKRLTSEAHSRGITIGFDLAHSAGSIPHKLHEWGCDFAVWCTYKYLNSGPGGIGGLFVHEKHHGRAPGLAGWFGSNKERQFDMAHEMTPAETAGAYQLGTPHVFSSAPLIGSLEMFEEVGIDVVREKSLKLTNFLLECLREEQLLGEFEVITPLEESKRGGHIAVSHVEAARICKALKKRGVIPDYRAPNVIRFAPIAFYTSFEDVWKTVQALKTIMDQQEYKEFSNNRNVIA
ncbi:kynureninase [Bacillus shivajii]|uniref:kynureninase n=1 Tax=Bacillus shivajii TaxID=1983719 RepID=UPI001CFBE19A|nr:kynureninase [Bacillus shivajii]UCZ54012.1 kynureninase [Bacillus shivajii]